MNSFDGYVPSFFTLERTVIFSMFGLILVGTLGLFFTNLSLMDSFFTATSAACVTGFATQDCYTFCFFSKILVLLLVQLGGLGLMTLRMFLVHALVGAWVVGGRQQAAELFSFRDTTRIVNFVYSVVGTTILIEFLGAGILFLAMVKKMSVGLAIANSLFLSISAFCNAGISPFAPQVLQSFMANDFFLGTLATLAFSGSVGFPFLYELFESLFDREKTIFSVNAKVAFFMSSFLVVFGAIALLLSNRQVFFINGFEPSAWTLGLRAVSQSIFLRNSGILFSPIETFDGIGLLTILLLMFIGSASGSTGGGIKTSTFAIILASVVSTFSKSDQVVIFRKAIGFDQVKKGFSILILNLMLIFILSVLLCAAIPGQDCFKIICHSIACITTTGISFIPAKALTVIPKLILCFAMIIGRVGPLVFLMALLPRQQKTTFKLPQEKIFVG